VATAAPASPARLRSIPAKHVIWSIFALMSLFVLFTRDWTLLDPHSFLRQRYAPIPWLMLAHGVPGALALILGVFQFSTRLRQRHLQLHRIMGRVYVGSAIISAPSPSRSRYRPFSWLPQSRPSAGCSPRARRSIAPVSARSSSTASG
jgi:small-conductance mechanosensitive channel